jgi:aminoglycoside phosphotransferase (APT) family kinase protein
VQRDGRAGIDVAVVERLIAAQFPQWQGLPVTPVEADGWDNRTYRLGDALSVRLPTAQGYVPAVDKERRWLPVLAPGLPLPIPREVGAGVPGEGYPFPWSVRTWLDGRPASSAGAVDLPGLAVALAGFLLALYRIDARGGPAAGEHSFHRGAWPGHYDDQTRQALRVLADRVDVRLATRVWDVALESRWSGPPVWFHGDVAAGNLLVRDGALAAVIDFGTCGVGDPACDLVIAWTLPDPTARAAFRAAIGLDAVIGLGAAIWARARGWALWKAAITSADPATAPADAALAERVIARVLQDHRGCT